MQERFDAFAETAATPADAAFQRAADVPYNCNNKQ